MIDVDCIKDSAHSAVAEYLVVTLGLQNGRLQYAGRSMDWEFGEVNVQHTYELLNNWQPAQFS